MTQALARLFPEALTLKAVATMAAAYGLTARREPGDGYGPAASRLFEVYPKGDSSCPLLALTLPELAAQVAAYAEALKTGGVQFHAPTSATRAAALIRAALTQAGVRGHAPGDYAAAREGQADPAALAVTFGAHTGGAYVESLGTPRALTLWAAVGGLTFREVVDSDDSEVIARAALELSGRVAAELSGRLARASFDSMGAGAGGHDAAEKLARAAEAGTLPSALVLNAWDSEGAAHAAFRAAELADYRPTPAARLALLTLAQAAYLAAVTMTAGHGKRDRLRDLAARCGGLILTAGAEADAARIEAEKAEAATRLALSRPVDPAEGMPMGVQTVTAVPFTMAELDAAEPAPVLKLRGRPEAEPAPAIPPFLSGQLPAAPRSVDVTPTWAGLLPALLAVLDNGTAQGRAMAKEELARMAVAADKAVADQKARAAARAEAEEAAARALVVLRGMTCPAILGAEEAAEAAAKAEAVKAGQAADMAAPRDAAADLASDKADSAALAAEAIAKGRKARAAAVAACSVHVAAVYLKDAAAAWADAAAHAKAAGAEDVADLAAHAAAGNASEESEVMAGKPLPLSLT